MKEGTKIVYVTNENKNTVTLEIDGVEYFAMVPTDSESAEDGMVEYVVLKKETVDGEDMFVTIDDDDEFDKVADYFDDMFDSEEDYDN